MEYFSTTVSRRLTKGIAGQRNLMKSYHESGSYEISRWPENTVNASCKSLRMDTAFGTVPRFKPSYKSTTPGPGYTLRTHNPFFYLDQKRLKGFSHIPSFEFDNLVPRFRETVKSWSLPCTRYTVKYPSSLQVFLEKITSKRGPYDLFTGPRDETTIKGYWARIKLKNQNNWPQKLPSEVDKLSNRCNYFKGRWSKNPRFPKKPVTRIMLQDISTCYKDPEDPGPGHYNPRMLSKPSSLKKYPFNSSIKCVRPHPPREIRPGPERYKIKEKHYVKGLGWTSVFKSKVPRIVTSLSHNNY
ncbi:hypothetical protein PUN28_007640 [Cardiocondyla obscurior]|uniref:Uncharacterized protein n=1 Tax=Cardiocondyla obscurior TaxID=286306 RepID=A0AAW2G9E8_9HYME